MLLFTYVRLAHGFSDYKTRLKSVQARLQALSVLIYSNQLTDSIQSLLYSGLLEELVDVLEMKGDHLTEIKAAALKALTSIIHLDRNPNFPKLNTIIDVTGAASYHGFLPVMVRNCISSLTGGSGTPSMPAPPATSQPFPQPLATALFSFLYHLASYEAGGEALVSCGMMESLLKVTCSVLMIIVLYLCGSGDPVAKFRVGTHHIRHPCRQGDRSDHQPGHGLLPVPHRPQHLHLPAGV